MLIETAIPGAEADAEFWSQTAHALIAVKAATPSAAPTAAWALTGILDRLEGIPMIRLKGGRIVDPANGRDEIGDLFIADGRVVAPPPEPETAAATT